MQNRTAVVLCALALLTGFLIVCMGAFFISSGSTLNCRGHLILAYLLLPLGFVILLSGIFWSTYCQANKNKGMFNHVLRRHHACGATVLATVDRPDFYPPAYEESLDAEKQTCPAEREALDVPRPLYAEVGLALEDESEAPREAPPSYEECVVAGQHRQHRQHQHGMPRATPEMLAPGELPGTHDAPPGSQLLETRAGKELWKEDPCQ